MLKTTFAARLLATAVIAALPAFAHAGFNGDSATLSFSQSAFGPAPFANPALVGSGVEFSALSTDVFGQRWTLNADVFDNGVKFFWTESTRANEPNGGNIYSANPFTFTLSFANSTVQPLALQSYTSNGHYTDHNSHVQSINYLNPNTVQFQFSQMHSTDQYVFTNAVPEPETYALMLGGLAMLGLFARRRKAD